MKVWVVEGNDFIYDSGNQWLVGIYSTEEKAEEAVQKDIEHYKSAVRPDTKYLDYDIYEREVDE